MVAGPCSIHDRAAALEYASKLAPLAHELKNELVIVMRTYFEVCLSACTVLQRVAVCCSVLQGFAVCCSVLQCVAVCCSVLQCVAVCCRVLQHVAEAAFVSGQAKSDEKI